MAATFPAEVDVFSVPHQRMKHLVSNYLDQLSTMDFANCRDVHYFLCNLYNTFCEFKSHEYIENTMIMKELKVRLEAQSIYNRAVCKCHEDNRLSEILELVKDGYMCTGKSVDECISYGRKLQEVLQEFTRTFLPHMQEEEDIFQPLLMQYFEYEELKHLKEIVIKEHEVWKEKLLDGKEKSLIEEENQTAEKDNACRSEQNENRNVTREKVDFNGDSPEVKNDFDKLPSEVTCKIFSYLTPPDRGRCARVCHKWNTLVMSPSLWMNLYPSLWARGIWSFEPYDTLPLIEEESSLHCGSCSVLDDDGDVDESEEACDDCDGTNDIRRIMLREMHIFNYFIEFLLPKVGLAVKKLVLTGSKGLKDHHLRSMLEMCPNLEQLDLCYTMVTDGAFKGLSSKLLCLKSLDVSGCSRLTDVFLQRLAVAITPCHSQDATSCPQGSAETECAAERGHCNCCNRTHSNSLHYLSLSGCSSITDEGVRGLVSTVGVMKHLVHLDLSGCYRLSSGILHELTRNCPNLKPQNLYYCTLITKGPFETEANGCQNLQCPIRTCCCLGE